MKKFLFFALVLAFIGNEILAVGESTIVDHHEKIERAVNG